MKRKSLAILYIFVVLLVCGSIFYGYQLFFVNTNLFKPITIETLNGFYASLFTAIAVIAALIGLGAWRSIRELKEKLDKFEKIEDKVENLSQKGEYARWVKEVFDKDEEKKIFSNLALDLSEEDKKKLKKVEEIVLSEATEDSWLKLINAKALFDSKTECEDEENYYHQVESIYLYLKNRDLFEHDSDIRHLLFHLIGQLYWRWYKFIKKDSMDKVKDGDWFYKWEKEDLKFRLLNDSYKYYDLAIEILKDKKKNRDESIMNKALSLIEMSKLFFYKKGWNEAKKRLESAYELLSSNELKKPNFNTDWDNARIIYYQQKFQKTKIDEKKITGLLESAIEKIKSIKDLDFFIGMIEEEMEENNNNGFPGNSEIIDHIKEYVVNRKKYIDKLNEKYKQL